MTSNVLEDRRNAVRLLVRMIRIDCQKNHEGCGGEG
jgi:hypothetical protein